MNKPFTDPVKLKRLQILFVILIFIIILFSYGIFISSTNFFQKYISTQHLDVSVYTKLSNTSFRLMTLIMILTLLTKFQQLNYQRVLMAVLMLSLLIVPVSMETFPIISACSNALNRLGEAWFQIFVPVSLRGTLTGIMGGLTGLINLRSIGIEEAAWNFLIHREHAISIILIISFFFFWYVTVKLDNLNIEKDTKKLDPISIMHLMVKYPYIFLTCFLIGFNGGMFYYTINLISEVLPNQQPQTYQYVIYTSGIISPLFIGRLADKCGIAFMVICSIVTLIISSFMSVGLALLKVNIPILFYLLAFIKGGVASSLWALGYALIGENLRNKGVFRSFSISTIVINIGIIVYGRVYAKFSDSFELTQLFVGLINLIVFCLLCFTYKNQLQISTDSKK
ncbi:MAG: hypothetical protein Q8R24_03890 [Legionellaceae bacterium]|nr:hypothetical protein [Legionellaceae bacterium]